jgi:hypothetical protein
VRQKSALALPIPQAPLPIPPEHPGEALPLSWKPGHGERHPRLTLILDPQGVADIQSLDDATLGQMVRLGATQAVEPLLPWEEALDRASGLHGPAARNLRRHLSRFYREAL